MDFIFLYSKKYLILLLLVIGIIYLSPTSVLSAAGGISGNETPFGGYVTVNIQCTCTNNNWLFMMPFLANGSVSAGGLVFEQGTKQYKHAAAPGPSIWLLGKYRQGSGKCEIRVAQYCVQLQSVGQISFIGTSQRQGLSF